MGFRNRISAQVIVGLPPGRQVIIQPGAPGQITFPNPNGFTPAQLGTTSFAGGETLDIIAAHHPSQPAGESVHERLNAFVGAAPSWSVSVSDGVTKNMGLILDTTTGLQAQLGSASAGNSFYGYIPVILNNSGYSVGSRWVMQIVYHSGVAGVVLNAPFNVALPLTFPPGQNGSFGWAQLASTGGSSTIHFVGMSGNAAATWVVQGFTPGTITFGAIYVFQYA